LRIETRHPAATAGAVLLALALASCDKHEASPAPSTPLAPSPGQPVTLARIDLVGPANIATGESVQLTASATRSDASVLDVTGQAQWSVSGTKVLEVSATGLAKGIGAGEAFISVRYQSRSASKSVLVLPAGTYRLKGRVTDDGVGLDGVTMTVIDGTGAGMVTVTGFDGSYVLYGVGGHVRLQAKRAGYSNAIRELDLADHRTFDVEMTPDRPRTNLQGRYTLTLTAVCPAGGSLVGVDLPRSYEAFVEQSGPRLNVTLTGADFILTRGRGNHFSGVIDGSDRVTFRISDASFYYYYYYGGQYDLVERLTSTSALVVSGTATATPSGSRISGELAGDIGVTQGTTPPFTRLSSHCYSPAHRFQMIRH
jgi:hypothetical protein